MLRQGILLLGLILTTVAAQTFEQNITQNALPNDSLKFDPPLSQQQQSEQPNNSLTEAQQYIFQAIMQISNGTEKFSLELYKRLALALDQLPEGRDFIISPFSVWSLLILTAEGALGNTYAQLQNVMGLPNDLTHIREGYRHIQNSLRVNTSTIELAVEQVMFTDKNRPVELDYEDKLSLLIFTELTIYTTCRWSLFRPYFSRLPFDKRDTREEPFYDENGNTLGTVNMMSQMGAFGYAAHAELQAHVLELPYGNEDRLIMYVLLPIKGLRLTAVIENIAKVGIVKIIKDIEAAQAKYEDDEVEVFLPRIRITSDFVMNVLTRRISQA